MNELISRISENAGISADQAAKALDSIKDFVKEKFPMMAGAVDNLFPAATETSATSLVVDPVAPKSSESILDKISDVIPGEAGQKVESFAKDAAEKAEGAFDSLKDKVSDLFGGDKK